MANKERLVSVPAARAHVEAAVADPILKASINNVLDELPAVDAVEVVRCKDCQSFKEQHSWVNGYTGKIECCGYCNHWDYEPGSSPNQVDGDDFCSYGERRDNNG